MKRCHRCGEVKPVNEFHKRKDRKDGLSDICKVCKRHIDRIRRNPEAMCELLYNHAKVLEDDPERLSTDFIKSLMGTDPKC